MQGPYPETNFNQTLVYQQLFGPIPQEFPMGAPALGGAMTL
jgi:hypothetical protein